MAPDDLEGHPGRLSQRTKCFTELRLVISCRLSGYAITIVDSYERRASPLVLHLLLLIIIITVVFSLVR